MGKLGHFAGHLESSVFSLRDGHNIQPFVKRIRGRVPGTGNCGSWQANEGTLGAVLLSRGNMLNGAYGGMLWARIPEKSKFRT